LVKFLFLCCKEAKMSRLCLLVCLVALVGVASGASVDCGSACEASAPSDDSQAFHDLQLPQQPSFLERGSSASESESSVAAEMETEDASSASASGEGELMGEFEGSVEMEGENSAEQEAEAMNAAIQSGMAKAMNKIQQGLAAGAGAESESDAESESQSQAESETESKSEADSESESESESDSASSMRFARRPHGKVVPMRRSRGEQPSAPWPQPIVRHAGGSPFDVSRLTPKSVNVDGKHVKLPAPIVIHQMKGQPLSDRAAPVDADDPCYDVCHFNGGWSTAPCQQCIFRGLTNGWVLHAIHDSIVGYNYAHWGRNQCSKKDNPFHSHAFSDCFFNTIHAACNQ